MENRCITRWKNTHDMRIFVILGIIQRARLYGQSESQLPMVLAAATAKQLSSKPTPNPMCAINHASSEPCCCIAVE